MTLTNFQKNEWLFLPLNKALSFLSKYHSVMAYLEKNEFKTLVTPIWHTCTTKQLSYCEPLCRVCTRKTDAHDRQFINKSRIHPWNQSCESGLSVVSKRSFILCFVFLTRENEWPFFPYCSLTPQVDSIMTNILFQFETSISNNTESKVMALFLQVHFLTTKSSK